MIQIEDRFARGQDPRESVKWNRRDVVVREGDREVFRQDSVEAPDGWSDRAVEQPARLYFRTFDGRKEDSVQSMVSRVLGVVTNAALHPDVGAPLVSVDGARVLKRELAALVLSQSFAWNTPVWVNAGAPLPPGEKPQCSACFIQSVDDNMESITALQHSETQLFRRGSGTGTNFSSLRPERFPISRGGWSSGPVNFMVGYDAWAAVTKSGGSSRRAAKMCILNVSHPDILAFIETKVTAQRMIRTLVENGWSGDFNDTATTWARYQNANHSVRVPDVFMQAVVANGPWDLVWDGRVIKTLPARQIWRAICEAAHECGDPGLQFDDTINAMHTCTASGRINASNPCCFVAETLVDTSEGPIPIGQLAAASAAGLSLPMVFAWDFQANLPVLRPISRAWAAGRATRLVEVRTQRGLSFRCTPEHRFYTADGREVEAQQLQPGTRLRKVARWANEFRSNRRFLNHRATDETPNGTRSMPRFMWEQAFGPIPDGMDVHHVNDDPLDDRLSNFTLKPNGDHQHEHSSGAANPRYIDTPDHVLVETWAAIEAAPKNRTKGAAVTPYRWNAYIRDNGLLGKVSLARGDGRIRGMEWSQFSDWIEERRNDLNDRVLDVTEIQCEPTLVYDLEVDGVHNFGIRHSAGLHSLIVHNSEYMFLDDSACNLASLNLRKFQRAAGGLDVEAFRHAARVATVSMEAIVSAAGYPTERIAKNSHDYRPLGLGYANLGAFLMAEGLAYDSDEGRGVAAVITALLAGAAYRTSAEMARDCGGPFPGYEPNRGAMFDVVARHRAALGTLIDGRREHEHLSPGWANVALAAAADWDEARRVGEKHGFRNSQLTVLAPTGTIGIMMDCDTTGGEPDTGLVRHKRLAGKGTVRFVNASVGDAMRRLGYDEAQVSKTVGVLEREERLTGVRDEHLPVFACAFGASESGWPVLSGEAHVRMVAAVQPYLSGAVSKTCNLPASASVEDVERLYRLAWETGCKAVAIYRDGSKGSQPLTVGAPVAVPATAPVAAPVAAPAAVPVAAPAGSTLAWGDRRRLPDERPSVTRKFCIEGHDFYFHIGLVEQDGSAIDMTKPVDLFSKRPLELFIGGAAKEGTLVGGLLDALGVAVSMMLQHGASFDKALEKWIGTKFDPAGWLGDPEFPQATSPLDAFARWARARFHGTPLSIGAPAANDGSTDAPAPTPTTSARRVDLSARGCPRGCGPMRQEGTCWRCEVCGDSTGGCGG